MSKEVIYMYGAGYGAGYIPQPTYYDMLRQQMQQQAIQPATAPQANVLPPQQVIQVAGRQSIDTLQMSPNSSVLIMDTSAPIVWLCVSDGLGKVTATAYDITLHQDTPAFDIAGFAESVEDRLSALESKIIKTAEVKRDEQPHDADAQRGDGKSNGWAAGKR